MTWFCLTATFGGDMQKIDRSQACFVTSSKAIDLVYHIEITQKSLKHPSQLNSKIPSGRIIACMALKITWYKLISAYLLI